MKKFYQLLGYIVGIIMCLLAFIPTIMHKFVNVKIRKIYRDDDYYNEYLWRMAYHCGGKWISGIHSEDAYYEDIKAFHDRIHSDD